VATETQHPSVEAAMDVIKSAPSVTVRDLPDGGIGIDADPPPRKNPWVAPAAGCVIGLVMLVVGNWLRVSNAGLPQGYAWGSGPVKLMVLGALGVVFGPMALLIQLMQGPPRKVLLEVRPGTLKADRSVGGDRVVSTYGAGEVQYLFVEGRMLYAINRIGNQVLIPFGDGDVNQAIATILASRLWHPAEVEGGVIPKLKQWVIMPRPSVPSGANA
jgi:hypothetical protein